LLWSFCGCCGHYGAIGFALGTLTVSTLLHHGPAAGDQAGDRQRPGRRSAPAWWTGNLGLPTDRYQVLYLVGSFVAVVSILATIIHLSGRWYATKAVNRLQVAIRRRVFAHAVRLPLHRVYQLKSGGATSLCA
jgi:ATP-binding cassette subfamily B protein/subfamily B ATP-binding cassette protein MsbA